MREKKKERVVTNNGQKKKTKNVYEREDKEGKNEIDGRKEEKCERSKRRGNSVREIKERKE